MEKETASVVPETFTDGSLGYNVEYRNGEGFVVFTAGCIDKTDAAILAEALNNASWITVDT